MNSKLSNKVLTQLINLPGVKVKNYRQHDTIGMIVTIEANNKQARCHRCGYKSEKLHQNHRYIIKDLPLSTQPVYLEVNRRQFKCMNCQKPFSEELDYVDKNRGYTKRLAKKIVQQVLGSNIKSVAAQNDVSEEEIERMLKDIGEELIKNLSEQQQEKLQQVKKMASVLGKMHQLKEEFREIFSDTQNYLSSI